MQESTVEEGRRAWMKWVALAGGASLLGGCAGGVWPRTVSLSEDDLMRMLAGRFPFRERYLQTLEVTVGGPKLRFLPQSNRIATEMRLMAAERLLNRSWEGRIGLSHGLRYEPSDLSVRLTQLQVDRLDVSGAPSALESQLTRVANLLAEQMLQDYPVHRFRPEDLRGLKGLRYVPAGIRVTSSGVAINLEPQVR